MAKVRVLWLFFVVDCDWIVYFHQIVSVVSKFEMGVGFGMIKFGVLVLFCKLTM